jgi:uncharacterized protein
MVRAPIGQVLSSNDSHITRETPMVYIFFLLDRPDTEALRMTVRSSHRTYLETVAHHIAFAGPLLDEKGTMIGSLLAIDFPTEIDARAWLSQEPFTQAGLYASIQIHAFENRWPQKTGFPRA